MIDFQFIGVCLIFLLALVYVIRLIYKNINSSKAGCGKSCKCGVDFSQTPKV